MKLSYIGKIVTFLQQFKKISAIYRISDSVLKVVFDRDEAIYFDMQRYGAKMFKSDEITRSKIYQAPFDVMLAKTFNRSEIVNISQISDDKIIRIDVEQNSSYKANKFSIQFEFTGKYTNIILLDDNNTIIEALRHIDSASSYRAIKVGIELLDPPAPPYTAKEYTIGDIEEFLYETYNKEASHELERLKKQYIQTLERQKAKVQKVLNKLENAQQLEEESAKNYNYANLVLSNRHLIKPYSKSVELYNFEGELITLSLPEKAGTLNEISETFFKRAKKAKQKGLNVHIQFKDLEQKIEHLDHFINTVENATNVAKLQLLFPKKSVEKKIKRSESIETFFVEGYKISLGKNERGNVELLQNARARDVWFHLQGRPSTHVIIRTDKQNVPLHVLEAAASLCVEFSVFEKSWYLVDYTPRREVTIQEGANVLYNKYKTLSIEKS